jgi:hypothetical protein
LLSRVKTTHIDSTTSAAALADALAAARRFRRGLTPDVVNVDTWFSPDVKGALSRIYRSLVEADVRDDVQNYLLLTIALTADRCSLRDQRIPVPVRRKDWATVAEAQSADDVWQSFQTLGTAISEALARVPQGSARTHVVGIDAASASQVFATELAADHEAPRLLLTSPPYGAAQKYIRSSSLALGWTGLASEDDLADLEAASIGREHLRSAEIDEICGSTEAISADLDRVRATNARRAAIYSHYFSEMEQVFVDAGRLLPDGGHLVMVVGSNVVAGETVNTPGHLRDLATKHGFRPTLELRDEIRGRVLLTNRANSSPPLGSETVHVLRRVDH